VNRRERRAAAKAVRRKRAVISTELVTAVTWCDVADGVMHQGIIREPHATREQVFELIDRARARKLLDEPPVGGAQ
jgi:hypothetical protein